MLNSKHNSGFTLIELAVVITVSIALTAVAVLNIFSYKNNQGVSLESQEIAAALRAAQNNSLSQEGGTRWGVYFENTSQNGAFYVVFPGLAYSATTTYVKNILPSNVKFITPELGSNSSVVFSPITGLPNYPLAVTISLVSNENASSTISVLSNGQIQF